MKESKLRRRNELIAVILALFALGALTGCGPKEEETPPATTGATGTTTGATTSPGSGTSAAQDAAPPMRPR